ncbi:MAG: hypothetical protein AAF683_00175 [Pseudomonadota bacterium]
MSRHELPVKPAIDAATAFIGWDRPLNTFFLQVLTAPDENGDERELVWVGTSERELPGPMDVLRIAEKYCVIDAGLAARLEIDRMETLAMIDGPNQKEAKAFLAQLESRDPQAD